MQEALEESRKRNSHKDATIRQLLVEQQSLQAKMAAAAARTLQQQRQEESSVSASREKLNLRASQESEKNWAELLTRAHEEISRLQAQLFTTSAVSGRQACSN